MEGLKAILNSNSGDVGGRADGEGDAEGGGTFLESLLIRKGRGVPKMLAA